MDIKQVNSAIMFGDFSNDELNSIINAIQFRRSSMQAHARSKLKVDSQVTWRNTKTGGKLKGSIVKIATKYATIRTIDYELWKVPMDMLETA